MFPRRGARTDREITGSGWNHIEQIMQLKEDFKENLVKKGRDHVRNNFSLHNMVSNYFNFYEKISI